MTTKEGIVTKLDNTNAWVVTKSSTFCKGCAAMHSCSSIGKGINEVKAINTVNAKIGDKVIISLKGSSYLKISFLFYLFPILSMLLGAIIGEMFFTFINKAASSAILGFLFLFLSFIIIKIVDKKLSKKSTYKPKITKILKQS